MSELPNLKPTKKSRVIDLIKIAGVDVSDWKNFKGGEKNEATNPKYCYEWAFIEPNKVVVLNLWHQELREHNGVVEQNINFRSDVHQRQNKFQWKTRAENAHNAIQTALRDKLPIRVVICDGNRRKIGDPDPNAKSSRVKFRLLDPMPWAITAYDNNSGQCTLSRGAPSGRFVDQYSVSQEREESIERREVSGFVYKRRDKIRESALVRANGTCEWCGQYGFNRPDGSIYLETHHIIPCAEGGQDSVTNVVALCPNHHREAHHGAQSPEMRIKLLEKLTR